MIQEFPYSQDEQNKSANIEMIKNIGKNVYFKKTSLLYIFPQSLENCYIYYIYRLQVPIIHRKIFKKLSLQNKCKKAIR